MIPGHWAHNATYMYKYYPKHSYELYTALGNDIRQVRRLKKPARTSRTSAHRLGEAVTDLILLCGFYVLIGRRLELLLGLFDLLLVDGDLQLLLLLAPLLVQSLLINQLAYTSINRDTSINQHVNHTRILVHEAKTV